MGCRPSRWRDISRYRDRVTDPRHEIVGHEIVDGELNRTAASLRIEVGVMLAVTFGVSAAVAVLQLTDAVLSGLAGHRVRLNPNQSRYDLVNQGLNLASITQLIAWGCLGYTCCGVAASVRRASGWGGCVFGRIFRGPRAGRAHRVPGLLLYLVARALGLNAEVEPSALDDSWWRIPVLVIAAFANGFAEETVVVGT